MILSSGYGLSPITKLQHDTSIPRRCAVAQALGIVGRVEGLPVAVEALNNPKYDIYGVHALFAIGTPEAQRSLADYAQTHSTERTGKEARWRAALLGAKNMPIADQKRVCADILQSVEFNDQPLAAGALMGFPFEVAEPAIQEEIGRLVADGDQRMLPLLRTMLIQLRAEHAWRERQKKGE